MVVMQKANRQIFANENEVNLYLAQGFSQLDEKGEIVKAGEATDLADIKAENATLKIKLAEYKDNSEKLDQFEALQKENEDLKVQLEAANKKSK